MANLVMLDSIKGHRCAQWKGKRRKKGKTRDIEKTKRRREEKKKKQSKQRTKERIQKAKSNEKYE